MPNEPRRPSGEPLPSRRARRAASRQAAAGPGRRDPRLQAARTASSPPAWRSPFALLTVGAIVIGLIVVVLASGGLGGKSWTIVPPTTLSPAASLVDPQDARALGTVGAPVTIELWSDFQCPVCGQFAETVEGQLIQNYVATGKVHLTYRDMLVIDGNVGGTESVDAAAAARCAADQGKFWTFHDYVYANQHGEGTGAFSIDRLGLLADAAGLDRGKFDSCLASGEKQNAARAESQVAQEKGVTGTPTFFVNDQVVRSLLPYPQFQALLDGLLNPASPAPSGSPDASPSPGATSAPSQTSTPAP